MTIRPTLLQAYLNPSFRNIMFSHLPINNVRTMYNFDIEENYYHIRKYYFLGSLMEVA